MSSTLTIEIQGGVGGLGLGINASPQAKQQYKIDINALEDKKMQSRVREAFSKKRLTDLEDQSVATGAADSSTTSPTDSMTYRIIVDESKAFNIKDSMLSDDDKDLLDNLLHSE